MDGVERWEQVRLRVRQRFKLRWATARPQSCLTCRNFTEPVRGDQEAWGDCSKHGIGVKTSEVCRAFSSKHAKPRGRRKCYMGCGRAVEVGAYEHFKGLVDRVGDEHYWSLAFFHPVCWARCRRGEAPKDKSYYGKLCFDGIEHVHGLHDREGLIERADGLWVLTDDVDADGWRAFWASSGPR